MSERKRAFEGSSDSGVTKKLKSESTTPNGISPALPANAELIAQRRAEIAAKIAVMNAAKRGTFSASASATASVVTTPSPVSTPVTSTPRSGSPPPADDLARRVAEAKRRVAEAQGRFAVKDNPYMSMPQAGRRSKPVEPVQQGAGLKMAAHPLLLDNTIPAPQSKKDRYKPMQPKFASIKANVRNAPTPPPAPTPSIPMENKSNPYASGSATPDSGFDGAPRERVGRHFRFNPKGKYVHMGNELRREAQLEQLKQRIAESARKAGLDGEFETLEKNIRATPADKNKAALKPLKLTKKEQKKLRKQRRQAELQDKRDRIRMGILPPDAPKVRLANLMKVLTSDAVQDPTRVEARVRREVAIRKHTHEKMNIERKLTDEQRREKIETKKVEEEKKGIYGAVFKVKTLSDPAHRFKVRKNAEQMNLTGVCIFNPGFSMIYVEGAHKFIRQYKRLMLIRIAWTEAARERGGSDVEIDEGSEGENGSADKGKGKAAKEEEGVAVTLEDNKCWLIWEGQLRDRAFSNFKPKSCPTDGAAKEVLGQKLAGYWDQAKNWKPEEEDLF
ncbi:hypothetical protein EW026_g3683 [Hermanssonia centrifuga]|uniref:Uncharacterized protein n=1 Tax=Hermanssonia centrifuga TaxID=98765 RepID=A0A4V3XAK3_9APHY|nr:hypothetical protein EW026_g3683 [Hermanssonia centrifuga]